METPTIVVVMAFAVMGGLLIGYLLAEYFKQIDLLSAQVEKKLLNELRERLAYAYADIADLRNQLEEPQIIHDDYVLNKEELHANRVQIQRLIRDLKDIENEGKQ